MESLGQPIDFSEKLKVGDLVEVDYESEGRAIPFKAKVIELRPLDIKVASVEPGDGAPSRECWVPKSRVRPPDSIELPTAKRVCRPDVPMNCSGSPTKPPPRRPTPPTNVVGDDATLSCATTDDVKQVCAAIRMLAEIGGCADGKSRHLCSGRMATSLRTPQLRTSSVAMAQ